MSIQRYRMRVCVSVALTLAAGTIAAADKLDLDRITPVPASEPIPVIDFFRDDFMSEPKINLSGTHVAAAVAAGEDHTKLMLYELATKKISVVSGRSNTVVEQVFWLNAETVSFGISYKKDGSYIMCGLNIRKPDDAYPIIQNIHAWLIAVPPADRLHPLVRIGRYSALTGQYGEVVSVSANFRTGKIMDVTQLDAKLLDEIKEANVRRVTARYPILETPGGFETDFMADKDGRLRFGVSSTDGVLALHRLEKDRWLKCPEDLDEMDVYGVGDDANDIVVLAPRAENKPRPLAFMNAATGKIGEILYQDSSYDFSGSLYRDPASHLIVGVHVDRAGPQTVWFTDGYRALQKAIDGLFPGMVARVMGTDEAGKTVLVKVFSDRQPPIYRWVDLTHRTAGDIQNSRPWIEAKRMQPTNVMKYKTRDGRKLDAYVTMPAGASKQNPPPLVVLPKESFFQRSTWGYDSEVQFYVSRGYAVMQPNHRGSRGYTWMFPVEDEWDFRKMHEDVTDATKTIVASGMVDGDRVAIVGTSFAGFLALEGAAFEPGLYRCAVAISPVSDWANTIRERKYNKYTGTYYTRMVRKLGDPVRNAAKFDAISPLRHSGSISSAVLVAYGEYDASDTIRDAKQVVAEVRKNGHPAEIISFVNEVDGVHQIAHKVELYSQIEAFLSENLMGSRKP